MSTREVELTGGAPWGFRMHGGVDQNQPLRISRVNPGRKASLSGIREGDVITSINGKATKDMSNADAHAMLRSAGPALRLGLNEDREMSPRRRSIGKAAELKRPSQLISDINSGIATPQAPVYATIRPPQSPHNKLQSPTLSLNSPYSTFNSISLVKSVALSEEPPKFHPTNPFYSTLPLNYNSSKLPIPNGKVSSSPLHSRSGNKSDSYTHNNNDHDLKLSSFFSKKLDSGPSSIPNIMYNDSQPKNSHTSPKYLANDKYNTFSNSQTKPSGFRIIDDNTNIDRNPFESSRISDFHQYEQSKDKLNDSSPLVKKTIFYSKSDGNFQSNEKVIKHSTITEKKISEVEEIKTIKKITLNGSNESDHNHRNGTLNSSEELSRYNNKQNRPLSKDRVMKEHLIPTTIENDSFYKNDTECGRTKQENYCSPSCRTPRKEYNVGEVQAVDVVTSRPPAKSPSSSHISTQANKQTVMIAPTFKARSSSPAIWRPGAPSGGEAPSAPSPGAPPPPPPPPVWTPSSATTSPQTSRKTFRPVHFEDTPPPRRKFGSSDQNGCTSGSESEGRLRTSQSAPATGLHSLGSSTSRLPRAQNPTVTLLQKAREGQIPRAPSNIQPPREENHRLARDRPSPPRGEPAHALRKDYASESEAERSDFERSSHRMTDTKKKIEGVGPTTKDGMPVTLRSEVKDPSRWYKKMYDTIHKNKYDEDYVTIRYKNHRGETLQRPSSNRSQYAYFDPRSGYLSEPEGGLSRLASSTWSDAYDSDVTSGPRRRTASVQEDRRHDEVPAYLPNNKYSTLASARARQEVYKSQPGRIENYMPGKSSVIDKEAKQWWDEVMDIFDGWLDENSPLPPYSTLLARAIQKSQNESNALSQSQASPKEKKDITSAILSKSNMARALKESGYESDSTLIFRRREDTEAPLSPAERRAAYRDLQAGGEPPIRGFRSPAPPRQESDTAPEPPRRASHGSFSDAESPSRRYVESDVNIHYRCPVRHDPLPLVPERELAMQQAEHMKRLYREQRRNKYLQENNIHHADIDSFDASIKELQDMQNRRHQDNFMPSQKTVVPLNRYDEAEKIVAKALYTFNGQTARELSFKKGDIINVRRQIDSNWYEGEVRGKIGLFPYNYVELLKSDGAQTLKKPAVVEGRARAKFDFIAQTNLELPLKKGEIVVLSRRIDHNWWEGRNANRTGIFPDSYVTILQEPSQSKPEPILTTDKPVASPVAHGLLNGTDKRSMGSHSYTPQPNSPALSNAPPATQPLSGYVTKSSQGASASERGYGPPTGAGVDLNNTEPLYVDTNAEAVPYRAMYKYRPQNPDELELQEGDTVYVLEKCDDGWYVGSSQRTGRFGTFPGNYVERI
ncbi:LOW QUALITY PROTEIN: sorbin and SH3 domain-containing protein 1-like [Maniola hyperantus]|uniref:LOW QUALITY PROTEIN: sorbin and SH3 domain-containing protein 1-like n=1 Tax=Aphantopus hyperantus TaxID=2795564 RepID=UPI0037492941